MRAAFALAAALLFLSCTEKEKLKLPPRDGVLGKRRCTPDPTPKNTVVPVFKRPFDGDWPLFNLFDHVTPGDLRPDDDRAIEQSFCGLDMLGLSEGHAGYAWGLPTGTPVLSVADGEVVQAGVEDDFFCPLGRKTVKDQIAVQVLHDGLGGAGYLTLYRHLSKVSVALGDRVKQGQRLGLSGRTGCVTEPVLFFGVLRATGTKTGKPAPVDPYGWQGQGRDPWEQHPQGASSVYLWMEGEAPGLNGR
jgi:murein DD-endopeptidase MepM/ murein hydrolase activator NlpD